MSLSFQIWKCFRKLFDVRFTSYRRNNLKFLPFLSLILISGHSSQQAGYDFSLFMHLPKQVQWEVHFFRSSPPSKHTCMHTLKFFSVWRNKGYWMSLDVLLFEIWCLVSLLSYTSYKYLDVGKPLQALHKSDAQGSQRQIDTLK